MIDWLTIRPIAHRGLHDKSKGIIENTSSAFTAAIARNYTIECDLQISADGEAMVFHDHDLNRLTDQSGMLRHKNVKDLHKIPLINSTDTMQTLGEMLDQVDGRVPLIIELKYHWDGNIDLALRALKVLENYKGPYALMSFDPDLIAAIAEYSPSTIRGMTADRGTDAEYDVLPLERRIELQQMNYLHRTRPHFVSFHFRDLPYAPVQKLRESGVPIITWTIRSKAEEAIALKHSDQVTFEGYAA